MKQALGLVLVAMVLTGCATNLNTPPRPALINHVVFFKLKDPSQTDALIADCNARLAPIPGIVSYFCGRHLDTGRESVDDNYDVGFYVGFNSEEDYAGYVGHPDHLALVGDWIERFERLQVRDVLDDTP